MSEPALQTPRRPFIRYKCSYCGRRARSGRLPEPPALPLYPLPPRWVLVSVPDLDRDDELACVPCKKERGL